MKTSSIILKSVLILLIMVSLNSYSQYTMPPETEQHEGTWLQWPHQYEYGNQYRNRLDATWVAMTQALVGGENVHIIAYNSTEQTRITDLLTNAGVSLTNVDFYLFETNDIWVRDNGPIFVRDINGDLKIEDWGFNGWGGKYNFDLCDPIPSSIGSAISISVVDLSSVMTIEGGAYEIDGNGVFLACKSSTLSQSPSNSVRNPGMTQAQAEVILSENLGVSKFIWLDGFTGTEDITDAHIDGFAKFANDTTLVTMNNTDLLYWGLLQTDITALYAASDINNNEYTKVYVPLTQNDVITEYGNNLGFKGSYCNYYIANGAVLVPNYNDPNDAVANAIIQELHPNRTVIGIDCRNLYENGGMVHCVTQQQPLAVSTSLNKINNDAKTSISRIYPNPVSYVSTLEINLENKSNIEVRIFDISGRKVQSINKNDCTIGKNYLKINASNIDNGIYNCVITQNDKVIDTIKLLVE